MCGHFFSSPLFRIAAPLALNALLPGLGGAIGEGILGAGAVGSQTLGGALLGGGLGALTGGGLKGALTGAISGGIAPNIGSFGGSGGEGGSGILGAVGRNVPGISDISNLVSGGSGIGSTGSAFNGTPGENQLISNASRGLGSTPSVGGIVGGSTGGGSTFGGLGNFNLGSAIASGIGGINTDSAIKKAQQQLLTSNAAQQKNLASFDPSGITSDPGYQFNLAQGQLGLNRSLGAQGNLFSGAALKAASQYNQDYANNAFNNYYQRWANQTGAQNSLLGQQGNINSTGTMAGANNLASSLSGVLNPSQGLSQQDLVKLLTKQGSGSLYG